MLELGDIRSEYEKRSKEAHSGEMWEVLNWVGFLLGHIEMLELEANDAAVRAADADVA
jgi:hypothetical protein